ncbi:MAG TPA: class D sortase [Candidatus Acidoferrales bacterium]|jgi:sortase A|nr:class D sortase [Candidatus Acidoferrales bacterium]
MAEIHKSGDATGGGPGKTGKVSRRRRRLWTWAERLLLVAGLALLAIYGVSQIESILSSRAALEKFNALGSPAANTSQSGEKSADLPEEAVLPRELSLPGVDFNLWDEHRVQAYKESVAARTGVPLAVLHISKIHLEVPVFDGTDDLTLNHAVGRIAGTARPGEMGEMGNIGIAGHRDGFFRGLKDVKVGDPIELRALQGTDTYVVDRIQIVRPDDVRVLQPRPVPSLTLVTCYPFYFIGSAPERYIVTASLTREIPSGSENPTFGSLSQTIETKRRNNEQAK